MILESPEKIGEQDMFGLYASRIALRNQDPKIQGLARQQAKNSEQHQGAAEDRCSVYALLAAKSLRLESGLAEAMISSDL